MSGSEIDVVLAAEADRVALRAGARGAADAVHVVGAVLRQVEVEDVLTSGTCRPREATSVAISTARCRVELAQEAQPLVLRHVAGHRLGVDAVRAQHVLEAFGDGAC
jgi:hypothetical protein